LNKAHLECDDWAAELLAELGSQGLMRDLRLIPQTAPSGVSQSRSSVNFTSNDYLNLARDPRLIIAVKEVLETRGLGAASSRLVSGNMLEHESLEQKLVQVTGFPAALSYSAGYMANLGLITTIIGPRDTILADRLIHASLVDAIRLSGATFRRFAHNDMGRLEDLLIKIRHRESDGGKRVLIVTESVFSMDGDLAPLQELSDLAESHGALLIVDEAHAFGVFGFGRVASLGLQDNVYACTGTLSKSCGSYGGFVLGSKNLRSLLINKSRTFIYNTALPPLLARAAEVALDVIKAEPERSEAALSGARHLQKELMERGIETPQAQSQILPLILGGSELALAVSEMLSGKGVYVGAFRPPTVERGKSRLRFSVTASHTQEVISRAAQEVALAYAACS